MRAFLIASLTLVSFVLWTHSATASVVCTQYEAQFSGVVRDTKSETLSLGQGERRVCKVKISFEWFNPHVLCPMYIEVAEKTWIQSDSCAAAGSKISGVLEQSRAQDSDLIRIDE